MSFSISESESPAESTQKTQNIPHKLSNYRKCKTKETKKIGIKFNLRHLFGGGFFK